MYKRDFSAPTLEDHFNKTILPKVMQVSCFHSCFMFHFTVEDVLRLRLLQLCQRLILKLEFTIIILCLIGKLSDLNVKQLKQFLQRKETFQTSDKKIPSIFCICLFH